MRLEPGGTWVVPEEELSQILMGAATNQDIKEGDLFFKRSGQNKEFLNKL